MSRVINGLTRRIAKKKNEIIIRRSHDELSRLNTSLEGLQNSKHGTRKVVIWGHKPFTHTHSFIHMSYYRAFKFLGFETYWFDSSDDTSGFCFDNCIILTEDQAHAGIPLNKTARYVLHHCKLDKYIDAGCHFINLCNYGERCRRGESWYYEGGNVEKLTYYSYFDAVNHALYQPWGTNLLPEEIDGKVWPFQLSSRVVYYIGSITGDNTEEIETFKKACKDHGRKFIPKGDVTDAVARRLVMASHISPDIRCRHHVNVGYIPCRIFKNISYGSIPATNSDHCRVFFGQALPYSPDCYQLYDANLAYLEDDRNRELSEWFINEVKNHHTYVTRIKTILSVITNT